MATEWVQKTISLQPYKRGCHVITRKLADQLPEIREYEVGLANFFSEFRVCCHSLPTLFDIMGRVREGRGSPRARLTEG